MYLFILFFNILVKVYIAFSQNINIIPGTKLKSLHILSNLNFFKDIYSSHCWQCGNDEVMWFDKSYLTWTLLIISIAGI